MDADAPRSAADPSAARWLALTLGILAAVYLLLFNRQWVPGGDCDFYLVIARNLATGRGYTFNGESVGMSPPGWPLFLAGLLKISPTFAFIKLTMIAMMLGSLTAAFYILRRFVSTRAAAGLTILAGTLHPLYPLTFWTHSEALFCVVTMLMTLLAFRFAEGRRGATTIATIVALGIVAVCIRWTGLLQVPLIAGITLSHGRWRWLRDRRAALLVIVVGVACGSTLLTLQRLLSVSREQMKVILDAGGGGEREPEVTEPPQPVNDEGKVISLANTGKNPIKDYALRGIGTGKWYAWLLWYPLRFGSSVRLIDYLALALGWCVVALLAVTLVIRTRRGELLWLGLAAYCTALTLSWPNPNARYFVPVAPFLLAGVWIALRDWRWKVGISAHAASRTLSAAFVAGLVLCNGLLLAIDIRVMRSRDFYAVYEAGTHRSLIEACQQVIAATPPARDNEIAVSLKYENLGRPRFINPGLRAAAVLTDRVLRPVPRRIERMDWRKIATWNRLGSWARSGWSIRRAYYLQQQPYYPWRVWHFTLSESLQRKLSRDTPGHASGGWQLWTVGPFKRHWDRLPLQDHGPLSITRVPGL